MKRWTERIKRWRGHTIIIIIAHDYLLRLPVLAHLAPEIFVERVEVILKL
jgi:hypothetical protein